MSSSEHCPVYCRPIEVRHLSLAFKPDSLRPVKGTIRKNSVKTVVIVPRNWVNKMNEFRLVFVNLKNAYPLILCGADNIRERGFSKLQ